MVSFAEFVDRALETFQDTLSCSLVGLSVDEAVVFAGWEFDCLVDRIVSEGRDRLLRAGCPSDEIAALCADCLRGCEARRVEMIARVRESLRSR
jgi:hypothetical protein